MKNDRKKKTKPVHSKEEAYGFEALERRKVRIDLDANLKQIPEINCEDGEVDSDYG